LVSLGDNGAVFAPTERRKRLGLSLGRGVPAEKTVMMTGKDKAVTSFIKKHIEVILPASLIAAGLVTLALWERGSRVEVELRVPGRDNRPANLGQREKVEGTLVKMSGQAADIAGAWPWFRGENHDGIYSDESVQLAREWPAKGPQVLWKVALGEGHAGAAVRDGRVYVLDYDREAGRDVVRCLSLANGQDIWRFSYPVKIKRNHGMSRTVPAVTDKYVVTLGPKCHVFCLDAITGTKKWFIDLVAEYGTTVPQWYAGQCPLIDGERVILAPAGPEVLMIAVAAESGEVLWKTPNPNKWKMTHSSIMPMTYAGKSMYVYCGSGGIAGVAADDGRLLWQSKEWKISIATVPSPVPMGGGKLFLSGGYNAGSMMMQLVEEGEGFRAEVQYRLTAATFGAAQHTPVLYEGHLYGVRPDEQLVCLTPEGKVVWTSGSAIKFGIGPFMVANGLLYAMDDHGLLRMAAARPQGFELLGEAKVLEGPDSWGPMAMVEGRLLLRDLNTMICLDMRAK